MNKLFSRLEWKKILFSFYWLIVLLIVIDQVTKVIFLQLEAAYGPNYHKVVIDNFLFLSYHRNTGAAWSILEDYPIVLALISLFATIAMVTYRILKRNTLNRLHKAIWALVIAGTFGNFIDRAFYRLWTGVPGVVDFISFKFGNYYFPIFNVADMCLVVGLFSLAILTYVDDYKQKKVVSDKEKTNE